jgi:hypothetical protein
MKALHKAADVVGRGVLAGLVGTAAITAFQMLEMRLSRRPPSTVPADAAGKVMGFQPRDERSKKRLATAVHWAYGTTWGLALSLLDALRVPRVAQPLVHFAAVWATATLLPPGLKVAPPVTEWSGKEIALGGARHAIYAAAADAAFLATAR